MSALNYFGMLMMVGAYLLVLVGVIRFNDARGRENDRRARSRYREEVMIAEAKAAVQHMERTKRFHARRAA